MADVSQDLHGRAFTRQQARERGVTDRMLAGPHFIRIHAGVYRTADTPETLRLLIQAATLVLPDDAALSHTSCLNHLGMAVGPPLPLHFATSIPVHRVRDSLIIHRYQQPPARTLVDGVQVVGPYRTFVDCGTLLGFRRLVSVGDWMAAQGLIRPAALRSYVQRVHFDGVQRARRAADRVRDGSASVRESEVRWELVNAGLPEPEINVDIHDRHGQWLARGDLVYRRWKLLVEYDGWQHERDAVQRQRDHLRREALEAAGWRVIVVTAADMASPQLVVIRVRQALRQRGCAC